MTAAGRCTCSTPPKCAAISRCAARAHGETLLALDGKTYTLDDTMCVIADDEGVELLAGIMGGEKTGCSETTTDVLIELALWEPINIAQTGRKLGINSDARYRFERGVDPAFMLPGLELATRMVIELCGGTPSEIVVAGSADAAGKRSSISRSPNSIASPAWTCRLPRCAACSSNSASSSPAKASG